MARRPPPLVRAAGTAPPRREGVPRGAAGVEVRLRRPVGDARPPARGVGPPTAEGTPDALERLVLAALERVDDEPVRDAVVLDEEVQLRHLVISLSDHLVIEVTKSSDQMTRFR